MEISTIIVTYNSSDHINACLDSVISSGCADVIIVDNASSDDTVEYASAYKNVKTIKLDSNTGFAYACNVGAKNASSDFYLFLNPDTRLSPNFKEIFSGEQKLSENAIYSFNMIDHENNVIKNTNIYPTIHAIWLLILHHKTERWAQGSCILLSKNLFERIGGWSEDYFMYIEDLDLFYNIMKLGLSHTRLPYNFYHECGGCSKSEWSLLQREKKVYKSLKYFYKKNNMSVQYYIIPPLLLFYAVLKSPSKAIIPIRAYISSIL